jgi:UDP-N-acetylglucosamine 2-epimerase (non-hydrolysing)
MEILHVVGARPNFMKAAPLIGALHGPDHIRQTLLHTGQHYDFNMSEVFFQELGLPAPDINLEVGFGSHAQQTSQIISRFEQVVIEHKPDPATVGWTRR